jgi:hypothetical protein
LDLLVDEYLENEYLDVDVSVSSPYLAVECLHELRHLLALLPVIAGKQLHHAVNAPLNIAHALVLIYVIELHL